VGKITDHRCGFSDLGSNVRLDQPGRDEDQQQNQYETGTLEPNCGFQFSGWFSLRNLDPDFFCRATDLSADCLGTVDGLLFPATQQNQSRPKHCPAACT